MYNAHTLHPGSTILFCLLLFRNKCKGFVKCFSDNPYACLHSFPQISSFMKELTVNYLFLYPRSRDTVIGTFDKWVLFLFIHKQFHFNHSFFFPFSSNQSPHSVVLMSRYPLEVEEVTYTFPEWMNVRILKTTYSFIHSFIHSFIQLNTLFQIDKHKMNTFIE